MRRLQIWYINRSLRYVDLTLILSLQMREIGEIELAIQGGTEKIESLGKAS